MTKIIENDVDYELACSRIYELINSDIEKETPEGNELEVLSLLVENYEMEHYFIGYPEPIEVIKFCIDQMNLNPRKQIFKMLKAQRQIISFGNHIIRRQKQQLRNPLRRLKREGFRKRFVQK